MTTLCALMMGAGFISCSDSEEDLEQPTQYISYILNEGIWGTNTAKICGLMTNFEGGITDVYTKINGQKMGDLANAMIE